MKNQTFLTLPDDDGHQICPNCNSNMRYKYGGIFVCDKCGTETTNDYGKVKKYLDEHGPTNAIDLAQQTGVSSSKISAYLREGKLEIPENSTVFLHVRDVAHRSALENTVPDVPNPPISKVLISATSQKATKPKSAS